MGWTLALSWGYNRTEDTTNTEVYMTENLTLEIKNLRSIIDFKISLPIKKGVYAITGSNGSGKSTILNALSKIVYRSALNSYFRFDGDESSKIRYSYKDKKISYIKTPQQWQASQDENDDIFFKGIYEASLIYGNRFSDADKSLLSKTRKFRVEEKYCIKADDDIINSLSQILGGNTEYYQNLHRFKSMRYAEEQGFKNIPYFIKMKNKIIHQLVMSSGEFLLIGLLDYIYKTIKHNQQNHHQELSILILDEIELALHPSAQNRLIIFLNQIANQYNFCVYFSTHSPQILAKIDSSKIYYLERKYSGKTEVNNPCYPAYATRTLYEPMGYDLVINVEDELAKYIIEKVIQDNNLNKNKLIRIIPTGGWEKTLELSLDFIMGKTLGTQCKILTILDGDIKEEFDKTYDKDHDYRKKLTHTFLPIPSIEKYLGENLIKSPNENLIKELGEKFFHVDSIENILDDYKNKINDDKNKDNNKKKLFGLLLDKFKDTGGNKEIFKKDICEIIYKNITNDENLKKIIGLISNI